MSEPHPNSIVQARYVGHYGRRHTPAFVAGVGEVYYGEVREMTLTTYNLLEKTDWELVDSVCLMPTLDNKICGEKRVEGSHLCPFHLNEIESKGILPISGS
jgi:hypothetical protein